MMPTKVGAGGGPGSANSMNVTLMDTNRPSPSEAANHFKHIQQQIQVLNDPNAKEEAKLQAATHISDNLDIILTTPQYYATFLEMAMRTFLKLLSEGSAQFIAEQHAHQVRKCSRFT